jgi:hypothetical protein
MTRSRAVSALVLAVSGILAVSRAGAASDAFKTTVKFSKAAQLADGSVLQANLPYEFQINFAGTGNTAEFEFILPGGKHVKQPAEAVGFSAASAERDLHPFLKTNIETADRDKGKQVPDRDKSKSVPVVKAPVESWTFGAAGFGPNTHPKATEEGGLFNVVVPSSNSPAFFKSQVKLALSPAKAGPKKY